MALLIYMRVGTTKEDGLAIQLLSNSDEAPIAAMICSFHTAKNKCRSSLGGSSLQKNVSISCSWTWSYRNIAVK